MINSKLASIPVGNGRRNKMILPRILWRRALARWFGKVGPQLTRFLGSKLPDSNIRMHMIFTRTTTDFDVTSRGIMISISSIGLLGHHGVSNLLNSRRRPLFRASVSYSPGRPHFSAIFPVGQVGRTPPSRTQQPGSLPRLHLWLRSRSPYRGGRMLGLLGGLLNRRFSLCCSIRIGIHLIERLLNLFLSFI